MGRKSKETIEREAAEARAKQQAQAATAGPPVSNEPGPDDVGEFGPNGGPPTLDPNASGPVGGESTVDDDGNVSTGVQDGESGIVGETSDPVDAKPTLSRSESGRDISNTPEPETVRRPEGSVSVDARTEADAARIARIMDSKGDTAPMMAFQNAQPAVASPTPGKRYFKVVRGVVGSYKAGDELIERNNFPVDDDRINVLIESGMLEDVKLSK